MRKFWCAGLALVALCGAVLLSSNAESSSLRGDYVEARTASVFAGACHYNGELTTAGREAVLAWNVTAGSWNGVDLVGVRAIAIVSADENLTYAQAARRSEIVVDKSATYAQSAAMANALKSRYASTLGEVVSVKQATVSFKHEGMAYSVSTSEAAISMEAMPDDMCCRMPQLVWYEPLVPLAARKVGYTTRATYAGGMLGDSWQRTGENSAFYGSFSF